MIHVSQLTYAFAAGAALRFPDFHVERGEHVLLLGQSGSGKTTLLHLIGGLRSRYRGSIRLMDTELSSLTPAALDRFRGEHIGFVFQRNHLINALTVEDNLRLSPYLAGLSINRERITQVLAELGIVELRRQRVHTLSQGQAQRVAIARAVLNRPPLLLADEPTSALDDVNCGRVTDLLLGAARENGSTLIVATHDRRLIDRMEKQIMLS